MRGDVILVAGNPTAYPVEYYDPETKTFQGVIPRLLREFEERTGCEVRYYNASSEDRRGSMAAKIQVDVISGCLNDEAFSNCGGELVVLDTEQDGEPACYAVRLTQAAPDWLEEELRDFLSEVSPQARAGMLVESAQVQPEAYHARLEAALLGLLLAILALGAAAAVLAGKLHRRRLEAQQSKRRDALTGVGNLDDLRERFQQRVTDKNRVLYVLFYFHLELSHVERGKADELLRAAATVLKDRTGDTGVLARAAETDFAVLRVSPGEDETQAWAASALGRIQEEVYPHTSAGVYRLRAGEGGMDEILARAAHSAAITAEEGSVHICTNAVLRDFLEERELRGQLGRGFENEEFKLYIQFYVDAKTGAAAGGKALSRWEHPEKGLLLPGRFLPCMEKEGAIRRLDLYAIEQSCAFLDEMERAGLGAFFLCCSLAGETVMAEDFAQECREILARHTFPREMLVLELPVDLAGQGSGIAQHIGSLREMGVRIAAGGFDGDVSSFLAGWRPDILTLHKKLVDAVGSGEGDAVTRAMIRLGHELGCAVFATGAEQEEQFYALGEMNCDMVQGYCLYTPLPAWEAEKQLIGQTVRNDQEIS